MTNAPFPSLRIVYLEDDPGAVELARALLAAEKLECELVHVEDAQAYRQALAPVPPDVVLADFNLPTIDGLAALAIKQEQCPDVPFIFVSGALGETVAIESLRNGATDFVLKDGIGRLVPSIRRALIESREHRRRVRAEQSLLESEARFRRLADNAPDVIFRFHLEPTFGYDYINPAVEAISGYRPEEFYADPFVTGKMAHPDDRWVITAIARHRRLPSSLQEIRWITKDGRTIFTEQRFTPVRDAAGRLIGLEGIVRDITERRRSEERIRMLSEAIEQSPLAVVMYDPERRTTFANARLCEMSGYSREELLGQNPRTLFSDRNPRELVAELEAALGGGRIWRGEIVFRRKLGEEYFVRATITPILAGGNRVERFLAFIEDITEWKQEQERRRHLEAQLFQAQKMETIGTLAGGIAHDFNNILTVIMGFTEIAAMSLPPDHPVRPDIMEVRKAGLRARDLVSQILTFSRQKDSQQAPLDLARVASEAVKFLRASASATVEIQQQLEPGLVRADPTQMHQVILNLGTNALHAMRGTHGRLTVSVVPVTVDEALAAKLPELRPGPYLRLAVRDTGIGMDAATMARIFDPFFTTKQAGEGTGLGLAIVRGIVTAHDGAIHVESVVGQGTVFEIYLPSSTASEVRQESLSPPALGRGQHLLVVDDEHAVRSFLQVGLERLQYRVTVIEDPRKAREVARAEPGRFHALVTDFAMPHMTGVEMLTQLRADGITVPAILTSGNVESVAPASVQALGMVVVLAKPFSIFDLGRALDKVLKH